MWAISLEGFVGPSSEESISNSETIADLFDRVNVQIDIVRTLKEPYTDAIQTVNYDRDLSILSNLKTLVNVGIAGIDKDLQTNAGIVKIYQYGGNELVGEIITDLASLDETKLAVTNTCDNIESATAKEICIAKVKKQQLKEIEADYLKRATVIVDSHQRILDRILEKQSVR